MSEIVKYPYDATGVEPSDGFMPAPEGDYMLVIKEVRPKITDAGDQMFGVRMEIDDANEWLGTIVWHNVVFLAPGKKGRGFALWFLKCIGEPHKDKFDIVPGNWIGKRLRAHVVVDQYQGKARNKVQRLYDEPTLEQARPEAPRKRVANASDDALPF